MDASVVDQLPVLLAAGAGAAAKGAAGAAGRTAFDRVRDALRRSQKHEDQAGHLDDLVEQLAELSAVLGQIAQTDDDLADALGGLTRNLQVSVLEGQQITVFGNVNKAVTVETVQRDFHM